MFVFGAVAFAGVLFAAWAMSRQDRRGEHPSGHGDTGRFNALTGGDWYDRRFWRSQSRHRV